MLLNELIEKWLEDYNQNYLKYYTNRKEPRRNAKQFFLYSYQLFNRLGLNYNWSDYKNNFKRIFLRDPTRDWYGKRSPLEEGMERVNSLEWANTFKIVSLVGFPTNASAEEKMKRYAYRYLMEAIGVLELNFHDIMVCSAIRFYPEKLERIEKKLLNWMENYVEEENPSPHQLIAYLNVVMNYLKYDDLKKEIIKRLISWIEAPYGTPRGQILIWARMATDLERFEEFSKQKIQKEISVNLFKNLNVIEDFNWQNTPLLLEAAFKLGSPKQKELIQSELALKVIPSKFYQLLEIFRFLDDNLELSELQDEIDQIGEKCKPRVSKDECIECMEDPKGICWIRILAKILGKNPGAHSPFEVADVVVYTFEQGIYFVIKAKQIGGQRDEGDVLYRQCTVLFNTDHALVFYLNQYDTAPHVIQGIREIASRMTTNPRFEVIDKKYIRQIYKYYRDKFEN